jgi:hypothetical protein
MVGSILFRSYLLQKKMKNLFCYILLFVSCTLNSQGFKVRHYLANASSNSAKAMFESSPGNYITGGFAIDTSNASSRNHIVIMGLGSQGEMLWSKKYKGHKIEYLNNGFIQRCFYKKDNFLYYAGCAADTAGAQIGVFIKFNMNGDTLWQKIYRDTVSVDLIPQIVTSSVDGGFLITGFFQDWVNHTQQGLILKTDAHGNELWRKKINKLLPNVQDGKAIVQDSASKKIAIVGYQYIGGSHYDHLLVLDSLGNKLKQSHFCSIGGLATDLIQTQDKKIVMVGWQYYAESIGGYNCSRSYAIKFDINDPLNPIPIWKIDGFDKLGVYNGFTCVTELKNGDLLIGGTIDTLQGVWNGPNDQPGNQFTRLTIVDKDGHIKWNRYYDYKVSAVSESNGQGIHSINTCADGSWLAAIEGYNFPGVNPFLFVKYDGNGCDSSAAHCATLNLVGVKEVKSKDILISIYPNPTQNGVTVNYDSSVQGKVKIELTDILGRLIYTSFIYEPVGNHHIPMNGLSSGMYLITISSGNESIYKVKIVKED